MNNRGFVLFKKYPLMVRTLFFVLFPLVLVSWFSYQTYFIDALPKISGSQVVNGIIKEVYISRDDKSVALIEASTDRDVYFAMGFLHAQDRLWQLEIQRRLSQGKLSEIFGKSTVAQDIWFRTLGFYKKAKASKSHLSKPALESLKAYASGINAWLETNSTLPIEFDLNGIEPKPWTVDDSLAWSKVFALNLSVNFRPEIQRFVASQYLSDQQLQDLFPDFPTNPEIQQLETSSLGLDGMSNLLDLQQKIEKEWYIGGESVGSNAWVVAGSHTKSGSPILANDPHLSLQIPSLWYPVKQKGALLNVAGMSLVGLPVIIFGKNQNIAWGGTNMRADTQDLYIEHVSSTDPELYKVGKEWHKFDSLIEEIHVKAEFPAVLRNSLAPIKINVRSSIHGPIISDVVKGIEQPVALRWTALDNNDTTYESFYKLSYAKDWPSFRQALSYHIAPALTMLYVDTKNNIGFSGAGRIPMRNKGIGALPVSGLDKDYRWNGYIPFLEMPQELNPPQGYIISANDNNIYESQAHFISIDWANPARFNRIRQLLNEKINLKEAFDIKDMQHIQADVKDLSVIKLLKQLIKLKGKSKQQITALKYLSEWDGRSSLESQGATIFYSWIRHLRNELFSDELKGFWNKSDAAGYLNTTISQITADTVEKILTEKMYWCDIITTQKLESCDDILHSSLQNMLEQMDKLAGDDIEEWQWMKVHQTLYTPIAFSSSKTLNEYAERRIPNGGSDNVVNVANSVFSESDGYLQYSGAGFRQIINFDKEASVHIYMNSTGQSGQIASPHYDDMVEKFRNVEYSNFPNNQLKNKTLTLIPKQTKGVNQ